MRINRMIISYVALYVGITAFVFAVIYAISDSQTDDIRNLKAHVTELKLSVSTLIQIQKQQESLASMVNDNNQKILKFSEEVDMFREQCQNLRKDQLDIKNDLSNKRPLLKPSGPIQIEILGPSNPPKVPEYTPTKNLGKKKPK